MHRHVVPPGAGPPGSLDQRLARSLVRERILSVDKHFNVAAVEALPLKRVQSYGQSEKASVVALPLRPIWSESVSDPSEVASVLVGPNTNRDYASERHRSYHRCSLFHQRSLQSDPNTF
jgi:hypothetical protein